MQCLRSSDSGHLSFHSTRSSYGLFALHVFCDSLWLNDLWFRPWGVSRLLGLYALPPSAHASVGRVTTTTSYARVWNITWYFGAFQMRWFLNARFLNSVSFFTHHVISKAKCQAATRWLDKEVTLRSNDLKVEHENHWKRNFNFSMSFSNFQA